MEASTSRRRRSSESTATKGNGTTKSSSNAKSSSKKPGEIVVEMSEFDRETPKTFRFQEDLPKGKERGDVGTVYVLKSALEKAGIDPDAGILVTVTQLPDEE